MWCRAFFLNLLLPSILAASPLEWQAQPGIRSAKLAPPPAGRAGFTRLSSARTGVTFTNRLSETLALNNQILENGAGVALGDVDGDALTDLYLCGSENPNQLFRNLGGWRFADVTSAAGVACERDFSTGAAFADIDGDGDLDLLVNGLGVGTRLFRNDGKGRFTDELSTGLDRRGAATSLALADIDGDHDLDLYVTNYRTTSARHDPVPPKITVRTVAGKLQIEPADRFTGFLRTDGIPEVIEKGEPDVLYLNDGTGQFKPVAWTGGAFLDENGQPLAAPPEDWGLSVMIRDFDGDGAPDIYVCNDFSFSRDRFWLGDGKGRFRAAPPHAWRSMPASSMAVDVADINRDGNDDFLVVEMLSRDHLLRQRQQANSFRPDLGLPIGNPNYQPEVLRNTLHVARGDGTFAELGWFSGLAMSEWSWSVAFLDVDLDGWEDVLVCTGNNHDVLDMDAQNSLDRAGPQSTKRGLQFYPKLEQPNLAFRNRHDLTFEDVSAAWGFNEFGISHALAFADLDDDGDLDVVVNNLNREAWLYRNDTAASRIVIRLKGTAPNTRGVGARIRLLGGPVAQTQEIVCGGRYLSSDDPVRVFAAGDSKTLRVEVKWRNGQQTLITNAEPNRIYEVEQ